MSLKVKRVYGALPVVPEKNTLYFVQRNINPLYIDIYDVDSNGTIAQYTYQFDRDDVIYGTYIDDTTFQTEGNNYPLAKNKIYIDINTKIQYIYINSKLVLLTYDILKQLKKTVVTNTYSEIQLASYEFVGQTYKTTQSVELLTDGYTRNFNCEGLSQIAITGYSPGKGSEYCLAVISSTGGTLLQTINVNTGLYYDKLIITLPQYASSIFINGFGDVHPMAYEVNQTQQEKWIFYTTEEVDDLLANFNATINIDNTLKGVGTLISPFGIADNIINDISTLRHDIDSEVYARQNEDSYIAGQISTLINSLQTIQTWKAGLTDADSDSIVNTLTELLALVQNVPEGVDLIALLNAKVSTTDIINNLTSILTNKPLSAYQGKVLKDLIDSLQTQVNGISPTVSHDTTLQGNGTTQSPLGLSDESKSKKIIFIKNGLNGYFNIPRFKYDKDIQFLSAINTSDCDSITLQIGATTYSETTIIGVTLTAGTELILNDINILSGYNSGTFILTYKEL